MTTPDPDQTENIRTEIQALLEALAAGICPGCGDPLHVEVSRKPVAEFEEVRPGVWRGDWACCGMVQYVECEHPREKIRPGGHKCLPDPARAQ